MRQVLAFLLALLATPLAADEECYIDLISFRVLLPADTAFDPDQIAFDPAQGFAQVDLRPKRDGELLPAVFCLLEARANISQNVFPLTPQERLQYRTLSFPFQNPQDPELRKKLIASAEFAERPLEGGAKAYSRRIGVANKAGEISSQFYTILVAAPDGLETGQAMTCNTYPHPDNPDPSVLSPIVTELIESIHHTPKLGIPECTYFEGE